MSAQIYNYLIEKEKRKHEYESYHGLRMTFTSIDELVPQEPVAKETLEGILKDVSVRLYAKDF